VLAACPEPILQITNPYQFSVRVTFRIEPVVTVAGTWWVRPMIMERLGPLFGLGEGDVPRLEAAYYPEGGGRREEVARRVHFTYFCP
jgi:hypothetical protein